MKMAVFHNLHTGGQKRALYCIVQGLVEHDYVVDEFTFSTTENKLFNLADFTQESFIYPLNNPYEIEDKSAQMAHDIDGRSYELVFVHPCIIQQTPSLLRYVQTPSVYCCGEPKRIVFEPILREQAIKAGEFTVSRWPWSSLRLQLTLRRQAQRECKLTQRATAVVANSYYSREAIYRSLGVWAKTIYLGVDADQFKPLQQKREKAILMHGTSVNKAPDFLIESVAQVQEAIRPKVIFRSGSGNQAGQRLMKLAEKRKVEMEFVEDLPEDEIVNLYNRPKLFALTSIMEPFGLVALEAMACGTPVVGVKEGGFRESVLDGKTGFLVDRDPRLFARAIEELLTNETRWQEFSQQARAWVLTWTWDKTVAEYDRLFNEVVKEQS